MRYGKSIIGVLFVLPVFFLAAGHSLVRADEESIKADTELLQKEGIGTDGPGLIAFFKKRTLTDDDRNNLEKLIRNLGHSLYRIRQKATTDLIAVGPPAVPLLKAAIADPDKEISDRARKCFERITGGPGPELPAAAARLLVQRKPAGSVETLLKFAPYADDEWLEEEVLACLGQLGIEGSKVDPILIAALKDSLPARRAAAGYVLGKMGDLSQRTAVRQLLIDPDLGVRTRAALGLVGKEIYKSAEESARADQELLTAQKIAINEAGLLAFFRSRTLSEADIQKLHQMVRQLGHTRYLRRQEASAHLLSFGTSALPFLELARNDPDVEIVNRANKAIDQIKAGPGPALPSAAARLLFRKAPSEALEVLLAYVPFADDDSVEEEILNALCALTSRDMKMHPALFKALRDELRARRGAAANVLARVGTTEDIRMAGRLLTDPDPRVKLRAAQGLIVAQAREALPVLVDLLAKTPSLALGLQVEDTLNRLAGETAPPESLGDGSAVNRQKAAKAWSTWIQVNGAKANLGRGTLGQSFLGLRVISEFDWNGRFNGGKVWVCDRNWNLRWKVENLLGPMDGHLLANGHLLVAENNGRMVREFDRQGKEVWKMTMPANQNFNPVACQRLANGNTFIAGYYNIMEVDKAGNPIYNVQRGFNSYIFSARKMRNGNIIAMTSMGTVVELENKTGKELKTFTVPSQGNWCSVEELRNGHFLVALMAQNKVVEYDKSGKEIRSITVPGAHTATKLPNGNILVAGMNNRFVAEYSQAGKELMRKTTDGRPWRINFR